MRRRLTVPEIKRLRAALKGDKLEVGLLRPWLWRRGGLAKPPIFSPISVDDVLYSALLAIGIVGFDGWMALDAILIIIILGMVRSFFIRRPTDSRLAPVHSRLLALVGCVALLAYLWPDHWPEPLAVWRHLNNQRWLVGLIVFLGMLRHFRAYRSREGSSWPDYVERVVSVEAF